MTSSEIIQKFELYTGDSTALSSAEELSLLNKAYRKVLAEKDWEFIKKTHVTSTNGTTSIALPSDFSHLLPNNSTSQVSNNIQYPMVVFIGDNYIPYQVVNWSDRRQYRQQGNIAFIDLATNTLNFTVAPQGGQNLEFDYIYNPADLTISDTPVIPSRFQDVLYHAMVVDDMVLQLFDKARSNAPENEQMYRYWLNLMASWNSRLWIQ
jgi:hypothetical protein